MLYRVRGTLYVGREFIMVNRVMAAVDPDEAVSLVEDRMVDLGWRCDGMWVDGPEVTEVPVDVALASIGAPRLPGMGWE